MMPALQSVLQVINSDPGAKRALGRLLQEGCDREAVITLVYHYCHGANPNEAKGRLKSARNSLKRWRELSERLRGDADEIERTIRELAEKPVMELHYREEHHPAKTVREFAHELAIVCRNLRPGLNPRSGRNEVLVYLCCLVKAATTKEHYQEIAALIAVMKGTKMITVTAREKAADAVRNRVARYQKENDSWPHLRDEAEDEVARWYESRPKTPVGSSGR